MERRLDLTWMQQPHPWVALEFGLHRSQYGGSLSQKLYDSANTGANNTGVPYWGQGQWWWHAAIGVPGVKWEMSLANRSIPEYFWLDPGAGDAATNRANGQLLRQWQQSKSLPGNLSQSFRCKLGALRYTWTVDGDAYTQTIHEFGLADLPAPFGPWGFGFILAGSFVETRLGLDLFPIFLRMNSPKEYASRVGFTFLHVDLAYRDKKDFHLSLATRISLENPVMRWPGARR